MRAIATGVRLPVTLHEMQKAPPAMSRTGPVVCLGRGLCETPLHDASDAEKARAEQGDAGGFGGGGSGLTYLTFEENCAGAHCKGTTGQQRRDVEDLGCETGCTRYLICCE